MTKIFAMRRANGDWFALENHGRFRVPLFYTSHAALMARLLNFGMLLFKPVALDAQLLREMTSVGVGSDADFCIVKDPFASLMRGEPLQPSEIELLVTNRSSPGISGNENSTRSSGTTAPQVAAEATASWVDV